MWLYNKQNFKEKTNDKKNNEIKVQVGCHFKLKQFPATNEKHLHNATRNT